MDDAGCGGVALVGPAGVGKTRLARQAMSLAAERGLPAVAIRATKSASTVPMAALAPLLTHLQIPLQESANLLRSVTAAIGESSEQGRLVIVVDDSQELDHASVALLDQLVGRNNTFIVLTVRAGAADAALLEMWKDERVWRVQLNPLPDTEIAALVAVALGGPVDSAALQTLVSASHGNVLFLRELVQGALEAGTLSRSRGIWRLHGSLVQSPRLQDLIDHRLRGLSEGERQALELVALGEPLDFGLLGGLAEAAVVERLEAQGLLEAAGEQGLEVRLAHPLYGEVVRARMPAVRRRRLCRSLADASEAGGSINAQDLLRVAVWRLDGGGGRPEVTLAAARMAFLGEDFELAGRLARAAWDQGQLVDAAILLADTLAVSRQPVNVEEILRSALLTATTDSDRTRLAVRLASWLFVWLDRPAEAIDVLDAAGAEITDLSGLQFIATQRAVLRLLSGDVTGTITLCRQVLAMAPETASGAQATRDLGVALTFAGKTTQAIQQTETALAIRSNLADSEQVAVAAVFLVARALALGEAGRLAEAEAAARAGHEGSIERRNRDGQGWFASILGFTLLNQGRLADADHYFRETAASFHDLGHPASRWGFGGMALAAGQRGDANAAAAAIAELDAVAPACVRLVDVHVERGRAWAAVAAGDLPTARATLWSAVDLAEGWGQLGTMAAALHDLVRIGDGHKAAKQLEGLAGDVEGDLMVARALYAKAVISGDPDTVAEASSTFEACGAQLFAAEAAVLEQRLSIDRGLHRRAAAAAVRAQHLAAACGDARTPALVGPDEHARLSTREREVALLAAEGHSSREIAERLFLSTRTVDNHLQRVYLKLGVTGRRELVSHLARFPLR